MSFKDNSGNKFKRALLCGPISGDEKVDWGFFNKYDYELKVIGINYMNPMEFIKKSRQANQCLIKSDKALVNQEEWAWLMDLQAYLDALIFCDTIYLLPGWDQDSISNIVYITAMSMGYYIIKHNEKGELYCTGDYLANEKLNLPKISKNKSADEEEDDDEDEEDGGRAVEAEEIREPSPEEKRMAEWFEKKFKA